MTSALTLYGASLRRASVGQRSELSLLAADGRSVWRADPGDWCGLGRAGDRALLDRCIGSTVDVGCGPGRLVAALADQGRRALGVDISADAVRLARQRGAHALHQSVFQPLPREGTWAHVLLADGNVGIGGDPVRLLERCAEVIDPTGSILVEVDPPGTDCWIGAVTLTDGSRLSDPFDWAVVGADSLAAHADAAALRVLDMWQEAGRWFAELVAG
jgi:SAM-dependent methyltransferase